MPSWHRRLHPDRLVALSLGTGALQISAAVKQRTLVAPGPSSPDYIRAVETWAASVGDAPMQPSPQDAATALRGRSWV